MEGLPAAAERGLGSDRAVHGAVAAETVRHGSRRRRFRHLGGRRGQDRGLAGQRSGRQARFAGERVRTRIRRRRLGLAVVARQCVFHPFSPGC